jgi:hypothetical protein
LHGKLPITTVGLDTTDNKRVWFDESSQVTPTQTAPESGDGREQREEDVVTSAVTGHASGVGGAVGIEEGERESELD